MEVSQFSAETDRGLRLAGWDPGRRVDTTEWRNELERGGFRWTAAAENFLSRFGGLEIELSGPGITTARVPFELDPLLAAGEDDRFSEWAAVVGEPITPVGELDSGRFFLGISESGDLCLVADWLASFGRWPAALDALFLGISPAPVDDSASADLE
ncbi:SUKH-3 domain-containing protein [Nocardia sp. NPDC005978]|uniref:SUKH-3 domain-containing protein n=1 Tax=Nocardia sp. NPDC005978 TaxID=3156725 RepID=UPI0033A5BE4F